MTNDNFKEELERRIAWLKAKEEKAKEPAKPQPPTKPYIGTFWTDPYKDNS